MARIIFMGTPAFAVPSLAALYNTEHEIVAVFTQPDKPGNRRKLTPPPVKDLALEHGTPVYQPAKVKDAAEDIRALSPDVIVVVAYGKILPQDILDIPPCGCINVHGSLLPSYRGAAPIQWAVLNGETTTGVTIMHMDKGLDTGDMIAKSETEILPRETSGQLFDRLKTLGADLLVDTLPAILDGTANQTPQDHGAATLAPPLSREMSPCDWTRPAKEVANHIHGLDPWPVATMKLDGMIIKLFGAETLPQSAESATPGTIVQADKQGIVIACGEGAVRILELQAPGKKRMASGAYVLGNPITASTVELS